MSRLIDADTFIEYVNRRYDLCSDELRMMIEEQPTAYDVEKVVAELEAASDVDDIDDVVCIRENKAIEIVKRGGVE